MCCVFVVCLLVILFLCVRYCFFSCCACIDCFLISMSYFSPVVLVVFRIVFLSFRLVALCMSRCCVVSSFCYSPRSCSCLMSSWYSYLLVFALFFLIGLFSFSCVLCLIVFIRFFCFFVPIVFFRAVRGLCGVS